MKTGKSGGQSAVLSYGSNLDCVSAAVVNAVHLLTKDIEIGNYLKKLTEDEPKTSEKLEVACELIQDNRCEIGCHVVRGPQERRRLQGHPAAFKLICEQDEGVSEGDLHAVAVGAGLKLVQDRQECMKIGWEWE